MPLPPVEVRRAAPHDAPALVALVREAQAFHAAALPSVFQPDGPELLTVAEAERLLAEPTERWLVALDGNAVVGYAHAVVQETPVSRYKRASARLHVQAMAVAASARRRGAGRALLAAVRAEAAGMGLADVTLEVYAFNAGARALYASEGFAPVRELLAWRAPDAARDLRLTDRSSRTP